MPPPRRYRRWFYERPAFSNFQAVPYNWVEYAHRALLWQVKHGGETFCSDTWGSKCQDEHGENGYPVSPNSGLPLDGAQGRCCWCPSVWHLWLNNANRGREPMLKCNFWGECLVACECGAARKASSLAPAMDVLQIVAAHGGEFLGMHAFP